MVLMFSQDMKTNCHSLLTTNTEQMYMKMIKLLKLQRILNCILKRSDKVWA